MKANYDEMRTALEWLIRDLTVLSGDEIGDAGMSQQDYIQSAERACETLLIQLRLAANGRRESFLVFPSPADCVEG